MLTNNPQTIFDPDVLSRACLLQRLRPKLGLVQEMGYTKPCKKHDGASRKATTNTLPFKSLTKQSRKGVPENTSCITKVPQSIEEKASEVPRHI
jgi:hypothetical protein